MKRRALPAAFAHPSSRILHPFVSGARSIRKSCAAPAMHCPNLLPQESFSWVRHLRWAFGSEE
jgi:hypothetical protein